MAGSEIFYNYVLRVETQRLRIGYRLLTESDRVAAEGSFPVFHEMEHMDRVLPRQIGPDVPGSVMNAMRKIGALLYQKVLEGAVMREFGRILDVGGVISLMVATRSRRIAGLPWEAFHDGTDFLVKGGRILVGRTAEGLRQEAPRALGEQVRVLVAALMPPEREPAYEVERRANSVFSTLTQFSDAGAVDLTAATADSATALSARIAEHKPHVVVMVATSEGGGVFTSQAEMVTTTKVVGALMSTPHLRCVFFTSPVCEQMSFMDAAWQLVQQGLPAVFCYRVPLVESLETLYMSALFEALVRGSRLDAALFAGRSALVSDVQVAFVAPLAFFSSPEPLLPRVSDEELAKRKEEALRRRSTTSTGLDRAHLLLSLGHHYYRQGRLHEALNSLESALVTFGEEGNRDGARRAQALVADCHIRTGDDENALSLLQGLIRDFPDRLDHLQVFAFAKLGQVLMKLGRNHEALNAFREALRINTKLKDTSMLLALHLDLGEVYEALGNLEEAESVLRKGLTLAERLGSEEMACNMKMVLGGVLLGRASYREAREAFDRAVATVEEEEGQAERVALCRLGAGVAALLEGEADTAAGHFSEALRVATDGNLVRMQLAALFNICVCSRRRHSYEDVVYYALAARGFADRLDRNDVVLHIDGLLEEVRVKVGNDLYDVYLSSAREKLEGE